MAFMARADVRGDDIPVNLNQHLQHGTKWEDESHHHQHYGHYGHGAESRRRLGGDQAEGITLLDMKKSITKELSIRPTEKVDISSDDENMEQFVDRFKIDDDQEVTAKADGKTEKKLFGVQMSQHHELKFGMFFD